MSEHSLRQALGDDYVDRCREFGETHYPLLDGCKIFDRIIWPQNTKLRNATAWFKEKECSCSRRAAVAVRTIFTELEPKNANP